MRQSPEVERLPGGPWNENCYLVVSGTSAVVVDPGGDSEDVLAVLRDRDLELAGILCTHGHFDHIAGVAGIVEASGVPLSISGRDRTILRAANLHSFVCGYKRKVRVPEVGDDIDERGPELRFGAIGMTSVPTPGHTPGSHAFVVGDYLLGGDTLLGPGLSDSRLPGADPDEQRRTVERLRAELDPNLTLLPGHGAPGPLAAALA
ncbi:MAG: MBL fold metallo-hydrolase [Solirubrobacteraceae bacterium]